MTRVLTIALKDVRSIMRNVPALAMMLLAPVALAALLGFAFGGGEGFSITATKIAVANDDVGVPAVSVPAGRVVVNVLKSPGVSTILTAREEASADDARRRVDDGEDAVAVIIPPDFSAVIYGRGAGNATSIELYENPTQGIGGDITKSVIGQTLLTYNGARAAAAAAIGLAIDGGQGGRAQELAQAAALRHVADNESGGQIQIEQRPPQLPEGEEAKDVGITGIILAGMMVFFLFFGASNVARTILDEEQAGTLPRLFTTPTPRQVVLGGKFVGVFVTVGCQAVIILVAGRLIFGIDWGHLDAVTALTLVAAAVASGLALLIISLVRTPGQAGAISAGVYLVLALVGGNFTGAAATAGTYATLQRLTPNGWLLRGWDTVMRGGNLGDIAVNLLMPMIFAVVFFAIAVWRFRRRYA